MTTMVKLHGRPWSDYVWMWLTMVDHGQVTYIWLLSAMVDHDWPWSTIVDHGQVGYDHGRPWSNIVSDHGRPWSSHMTMFVSYIIASMNSVWWWSNTAWQLCLSNNMPQPIRTLLPNILVISIWKYNQYSFEYVKKMLIKVNKVEHSYQVGE